MLIAFVELQKYRDHKGTTNMDIFWEELASSETPFSKMIDLVNTRLRKFLPSYMIPSAYIPIRTLPMTNVFKINRRILREKADSLAISDIQKATSGPQYKPTNRLLSKDEEALRDIWAEALHIDPNSVNIQDNFFRIGGDSLKAMAVVSAARRRGMSLSVAKLYQFPNVTELTQNTTDEASVEARDQQISLLDAVDAQQIQELAGQQYDIDPNLIDDIMPITYFQYYYLSSQANQPRSWICTIAFDLPPSVEVEKVKRAWEKLMAHHPITRTRFVNTKLGFFQVILKSEPFSWTTGSDFNDLMDALGAKVRGFGCPPHASAILTSKDQTPSRLIWYASHAVFDVLMNELLSQELASLCGDESHSLPRRPTFKSVIQHRLNSDRKSSQTFWRSHLSGADFKALFKENQITDTLANGTSSREAELNVPVWLEVLEYSMVLTALALALTRVTGVEHLAMFLVRMGRVAGMPGSEDVVGPLLTRAPLRVSVKRDRRMRDMLRDVDRDFKEASKHEIVDQADFHDAAPEAAAYLKHGVNVNFTPPTSGLTLGRDAMFPVNSDFRDGLAERNRIFSVFGNIFRGKLKMDVIYEEEAVLRSTVQRFLDDWQAMVRLLSKVDPETTVARILST